ASCALGGLVETLLALTRLGDRRPDGVVLVRVADGGGHGARLGAAADDDPGPRLLDGLRPDVVGLRALAWDPGELPVELVEAAGRCHEVESVRVVLRLVPAGAEPELDAAAGDVVGGGDELREH